jgi:hypothetical protein
MWFGTGSSEAWENDMICEVCITVLLAYGKTPRMPLEPPENVLFVLQ